MVDLKTILSLCFLLLILAKQSAGQQIDPISTDRPDQSNGVYTLPKGNLQLETGGLYGQAETHYFLQNTLLRYGLVSGTELRLGMDYGHQDGKSGVLPVLTEVKQHIREQKGIVPAMAVVGGVNVPFLASSAFRPDKLPVALTFAFENALTDQFGLAYNIGTYFDGIDGSAKWLFTLNFSYSPTEAFSFFSEYFSRYGNGMSSEHNLDAGVFWRLKDNLQLDLAFGTDVFRSGRDGDQFITLGISYRFDRGHEQ